MHPRDQDREFAAVRNGLVVTAALCVVELVGGWFTNSLALVSDAAHLFADVAALAPTLFALWVCPRGGAEKKTLGYYRAQIPAALGDRGAPWGVVPFILAQASPRVRPPPPVARCGLAGP